MDTIVIAGGVPAQDDPLYPFSLGKPKTLIDIAGKPMGQWVLDALGGAKHVSHVVVIGLEPSCGLTCSKPLEFIPSQDGMLNNALAGLYRVQAINPDNTHALLASADVPGITPEMVDWRIERALETECELDYVAVERKVMESRFPNANRSYIHLKGLELCGGDVHVLSLSLIERADIWERFIAARKSPLKQAALVGLDTLFWVLSRQLTIQRAERLVSKRLGFSGRVHLSPYAELAMDVDKPHQLEIMRRDLAGVAPQT